MHAMNRKARMMVALLALAGTAGIAATAQAGTAAGPQQARYDDVVVNYGDLDMNSAAGVKALYVRLQNASERACGSAPVATELKRRAQFRACVASTLDRAVDKVGTRNLQALHRTRAASEAG